MCCLELQDWLIILKSRFWSLPEIRSQLSYMPRQVRGIQSTFFCFLDSEFKLCFELDFELNFFLT